MTFTRRSILTGMTALAASAAIPRTANAFSGAVNANSSGLRAGSVEDQGKRLQTILDKAARERKPVFIEPGIYRISRITLPEHTHLLGIEGTSVLQYTGRNHFLSGENCETVTLSGLTLDGKLMPLKEYAQGLVAINGAKRLKITDCSFTNSSDCGMHILRASGQVSGNTIDNAVGAAGILAHNNLGLDINGNLVEACANGGILIHRWTRGEDNSTVTNNRIRRIAAVYGGTGQWGNGINTYLADGVLVSDNHITDCAFSAIRSNSCSNVQISDNTCLRSGETAVYSEFAYQGAKITGNIIDGGVTGISMANFNEGGRLSVCSGNLIRNIHDRVPYEDDAHIRAIGIALEADTVASANVIETTKNFGMLLGWGPYLRNVIASNNMIRDTKTGMAVSVVDGIGQVKISGNIFSQIKDHAIAGYRWQDRVTKDLATSKSAPVKSLKISGNQIS